MWGADPELQAGQPSPPVFQSNSSNDKKRPYNWKNVMTAWWLSYLPLWKMMEFVNWFGMTSHIYEMENKSHVPNHQPVMKRKKHVAACSVRTSSGFIRLFKDVPSGKRLHNYGKIHHAIHGKIHYSDWAIFHSQLLVITRPGISHGKSHGKSHWTTIKSYGFPMVFLWFSTEGNS